MGLPSPEQASTWGGEILVDREGAAIGPVTQIYNDNATGLPEWATIRLGEATVFLPLLDAVEADGRSASGSGATTWRRPRWPGRAGGSRSRRRRASTGTTASTTPGALPERTAAGSRSGPEPRRAAPAPCARSGAGPLARGAMTAGCGGHRRARSSAAAAPFVAPAVVVRQARISRCAARNSQRRERRTTSASTPPSPVASDRYSGDSTGQSADPFVLVEHAGPSRSAAAGATRAGTGEAEPGTPRGLAPFPRRTPWRPRPGGATSSRRGRRPPSIGTVSAVSRSYCTCATVGPDRPPDGGAEVWVGESSATSTRRRTVGPVMTSPLRDDGQMDADLHEGLLVAGTPPVYPIRRLPADRAGGSGTSGPPSPLPVTVIASGRKGTSSCRATATSARAARSRGSG